MADATTLNAVEVTLGGSQFNQDMKPTIVDKITEMIAEGLEKAGAFSLRVDNNKAVIVTGLDSPALYETNAAGQAVPRAFDEDRMSIQRVAGGKAGDGYFAYQLIIAE